MAKKKKSIAEKVRSFLDNFSYSGHVYQEERLICFVQRVVREEMKDAFSEVDINDIKIT